MTAGNPDFYYDPILGLQYHFHEPIMEFDLTWIPYIPVKKLIEYYNRMGIILQN